MKLNKSLLAATLALGMASLLNAQTTVYMTGSTAMRSTVYSALIAPGVVFSSAPSVTLFQGGGNKANYMAFSGTLVSGGTAVLQCHWSGSEGGILDVVSNTIAATQESFIGDTLDGTDHGSASPSTLVYANVDLAMADNAQAYSRSRTPTLANGTFVGVITFQWVRNKGLWTGTNVTDSMIRKSLLSGGVKRAVFSGNSSETNDYVYVSGRDNLSGTRVNALGTSGYGILTLVNQIQMNSSGVMQDVSGFGDYIGDEGFTSGGTLAGTMGADTTSAADLFRGKTGYSVIAYAGVSDAQTATNNGAVMLSYNGIPFSPEAVKNGTYTFWGNEYIYKANNVAVSSAADKIYTALAATTGINAYCDGVKAIKVTDMLSTRTGPTADPTHK